MTRAARPSLDMALEQFVAMRLDGFSRFMIEQWTMTTDIRDMVR
jgi:hypothetical protein